VIGDMVVPPALRGGTATVYGDPDLPHAFSFVPDIARTLVALGERDDALGQVWHVPNAPASTTRRIVELVYEAAATRRGCA
jgi:nucleoside-diphosphate-sugar epimerase